jgi:hypothetical protein
LTLGFNPARFQSEPPSWKLRVSCIHRAYASTCILPTWPGRSGPVLAPDANRVAGAFTLGAHTVTAELVFDDDHDLVDFVSDDRLRSSAEGTTFTRQRWSTPIGDHREAGSRRLAATGEARWHAPQPEGEFAYLEFHLGDISYNTTADPLPTGRQDTSTSR